MIEKLYRVIRKLLLISLPSKYVLYSGDRNSNALYLTFDDGPHAEYTDKVLDVLQCNSIKATFFLVGDYLANNTEVVNHIYKQGHFICNHSVSHNDFANLDSDTQVQSIKNLNSVFKKIDSVERRFFRPPRGDMSIRFILKMVKANIPIAMWSYDSFDYKNLSGTEMVSRFEKKPVKGGEVILFHDDNVNTVDALILLLPYWKKQGFQFKLLRCEN